MRRLPAFAFKFSRFERLKLLAQLTNHQKNSADRGKFSADRGKFSADHGKFSAELRVISNYLGTSLRLFRYLEKNEAV